MVRVSSSIDGDKG